MFFFILPDITSIFNLCSTFFYYFYQHGKSKSVWNFLLEKKNSYANKILNEAKSVDENYRSLLHFELIYFFNLKKQQQKSHQSTF